MLQPTCLVLGSRPESIEFSLIKVGFKLSIYGVFLERCGVR
jgi:hypothetical protein